MLDRLSHRHELRDLRLAVQARADFQARNSSKLISGNQNSKQTRGKRATQHSAHQARSAIALDVAALGFSL